MTNNSERSKVKVSVWWEVVVYIMSNSCLHKPGQSCDKTRARESSEVGKTLVDGRGSYGGRKGGRETERERMKEKEKAYNIIYITQIWGNCNSQIIHSTQLKESHVSYKWNNLPAAL